MTVSPLNVEEVFNKGVNAAGYRDSILMPHFAPQLTNVTIGTAVGAAWTCLKVAALAAPTIIIPFVLPSNFAPGSGSGTKYIPLLRLRVLARMVDLGGAAGSALTLQGAARFITPTWNSRNGTEIASAAAEVTSAAATLVRQDNVGAGAVGTNAFDATTLAADTVTSNLRIYEYDPLLGLTAAQRALLVPETLCQITLTTSIAIPANSRLDIFGWTLEQRRHVGIWDKFRRIWG